MGKVHNEATMMKEASLFLPVALFPLAVPKCKLLFQLQRPRKYSDYRLYRST